MAPSAKFVSVNLNKSYGQSSSSSPSSSSSSISSSSPSSFSVNTLPRSRSYGGGSNISHGGVVSLSRPSTRISSPSPSSSSSSAPSPLPRPLSSSSSSLSSSLKLSVPRPVNLPSLRREHAGNDPTISLVASSAGSSHGWTRHNVDESLRHDPSSRSSRSESSRIVDSTKGTISSSSASPPIQGQNGGGKEPVVSAYTPPGSRPPLSVVSSPSSVTASASTSAAGLVSHLTVEKAVVFRGEDFPSLQASVPSSTTSLQIKQQQRDSILKQQEKPSLLVRNESSKKIHHQEDSPVRESRSSGSESTGIELRSTESRPDSRGKADDAGSDSRGVKDSRISRGSSPLIKLEHTSNWADDERETLSSFQPQERSRLELGETYSTVDSWTSDYRDVKRPTSRNGYLGRNDADASGFILKGGYTKEAGGPGQFANNASRFERDYRGDGDRLDMNAGGRNDYLKRGWSFSAGESRDVRMYSGGANMLRNHMSGSDFMSRDMRQGQEYRSSRDIHGKQGVSGGHGLQGERSGRGSGFPYAPPDAPIPRLFSPRQDVVGADYYARERRSGFREHIRSEDPFLGDIMDARAGSFMGSVALDVKVSRMKKDSLKDENVRDLARESFEAELERVQKMLELESQRAAEEQERAMEIARKEQEEQERIAREEEEMRLKLEEEAREKALRAEREAEEAVRRVEEVRRAREEEKRMAALEEERRKEAARKKLLELEERMAKRQEQSLHKGEVRSEEVVQQRKNEVAEKDLPGKSIHGSNKDVQDGDDDGHEEVSALPNILKLPFASSYGKGGHGLSTQKSRYTQDWRRENTDNGQGAHSAQQGSTRNTLSRDDVNHSDYDDQRSFKNATRSPAVNWDAQERVPPNNSMDKDVGNWWTKDDPSRFEPPVASYPSEYPLPFGRLRQSLPKQPKVLPPPPGPVMIRKQHFQSDEKETKTESFGISSSASESMPKKDSLAEVAIEVVSHEINKGDDGGDMALKQFENIPSEEVVLSDAVSQFSDDSIEDEQDSTGHAYEDQDSHSDVVSETYTEEVDEISDLTDAQISSEEVEASGDLQASKEEEPRGSIELRADFKGNVEEGKAVNQCDKVLVKGEDISVRADGGKQQLVLEDETHEGSVSNGYKGMDKARNSHQERSVSFAPVDGQTNPQTGSAAQKTVQDQVMHHYSHHIPFLPVNTMDALPMAHHSEGLGSRHSLLQQFQQPFSFMALPLPQPTNLNNVPASQSVPSSTQSLQNQQELPFLQLGLLSGVPFMPSAIQIGSIQMPLHIHPQIPQFAQLHGQQQPIFQFGQIGHSGSASHASTILQPGLQIHTTAGQGMLPQDRELQSEHVTETVNEPSNLEQSVKLGADAIVQVQSDKSISTSWISEHVEDNKSASIPAPRDVKDSSIREPTAEDMAKPHQARNRTSNNEDAYGVKPASYMRKDLNAVSSRPSRGRRRNDPSFYQGILGRGRGRFRGGRNNRYQGFPVVESWPESGPKRGAQRRIYRRSTQRLEYKVRMPLPTSDGEPSAIEIAEDLTVNCANKEGSGEVEKATVANKDSESRPAVGHYSTPQMNAYSGGHPKQAAVNVPSQNNHASNKALYKKYEVDITEDAPLRSGIVYVFEQRGIETQNDKDDFIEVRSKRQLLREQREQREKENKAKSVDNGVLKTQRSNTKAGAVNSNRANTKKNVGQGKEVQPVENRSMASHRRAGTDTTGTPVINTVAHVAPTGGARTRNKPSESTSTKPVGGTSSVSSVATMEASVSGGYQSERRSSEPSLPTAWGGQRSNQEVVSLTQIQLEEAMKPFRLEGHFPDQSPIPDRNPVVPDTGIPRITVSISEKSTVPSNVPGSISSLLAGEKIQFGAVTSSPPIPSSSPLSPLSNTQMIELRSEASRVSQFLESDGGTAFSVKEKNGGTHDSFQRKVIDLEAEAEAAASAVAVAAISNEDVVQTHSILGSGGIDGDGTHPTTPGLRPVGIQASNVGLSESSISVSLPADLLVEMPPPSYQNSTISLPASSGVMMQSLPGGGPPYPCLEMGPMLGGPIFTYGPREDASFASMEPGLSGWQQRHLGTPDSFYGTSPFMNPASLSGIQGHPHMVVYANPFTPVGQFGQLGVGFMGTTYHPSKQPDWTHIPLPSASSGALGLNDGEINAGLMASRHANGISNPNAPQQSVTGPCMMPLNAPSVFEAGLSTTFQSHWSKAPAPPVSSMGMSSPMQTGSVVGSTLDRSGQPHLSRAIPNQMGHIAHLMDVSSGFNELPVLKPVARSSYTSSDATPQFPDELGLGETRPTTPSGNSLLNDSSVESSMAVGGSVSKLSRQNRRVSRPLHGVKGGLSVNSRQEPLEALQKHRNIRIGPPAGRPNPPSSASVPFPDARGRTSQQSVAATDNVRTEWVGNSQRRVASGRFSSDKGSTGQPPKVKQIYVPKSANSTSTKLGAISDLGYRV